MMSEKVFVRIDDGGKAVVARVQCTSIGQREAGIIETELALLGERTNWRFALDLSEVKMMASLGLGMLITMTRMTNESKGKIAMFGLNSDLSNLIRITKLDRLLPVAKDEKSAISKVS